MKLYYIHMKTEDKSNLKDSPEKYCLMVSNSLIALIDEAQNFAYGFEDLEITPDEISVEWNDDKEYLNIYIRHYHFIIIDNTYSAK